MRAKIVIAAAARAAGSVDPQRMSHSRKRAQLKAFLRPEGRSARLLPERAAASRAHAADAARRGVQTAAAALTITGARPQVRPGIPAGVWL